MSRPRVDATFGIDGYTVESFGTTEREAFRIAVSDALAGVRFQDVKVTRVTSRMSSARRKLSASNMQGVDVAFRIEFEALSTANDVRGGIDALILQKSDATVSAMKKAGLNKITGLALTTAAVVTVPYPPPPSPSPPSPPPRPPLVEDDFDSSGSSGRSSSLRNALLTAAALMLCNSQRPALWLGS